MDSEHIIHRVESLPGVVNQCVMALRSSDFYRAVGFLTRPASSIMRPRLYSAGSASKQTVSKSGRCILFVGGMQINLFLLGSISHMKVLVALANVVFCVFSFEVLDSI